MTDSFLHDSSPMAGVTAKAAFNLERLVIDAQHHLWDGPDWRYLLDDYFVDLDSLHCAVESVFVQC